MVKARTMPWIGMGVWLMAGVCASSQPAGALEIGVVVDRGEDLGQSFGSLFEASTKDGAFVIGAGFLDVYNTYDRSDRHTVHFFIRPAKTARAHTIEPLPRPSDLAGTYLFARGDTLYATNPEIRAWHEAEGRWEPDTAQPRGRMQLGNGLLLFDNNRVEFNGKPILTKPDEGDYYRFYYAQGHLFFYHTFWADQRGYRDHTTDAEGYTKLYACPWKPGDDALDMTKAVVKTLPFVGESPFAYGQFRGDVLSASNIGGLYAFDGTQWRTVLDGKLGESYQVYSMINLYDRLLLGQYPTGELFEFDGESVTHLEGWPPRMPGVSPNAREAQTTIIYGGDLFVGVWPWGEVWRYQPDTKQWDFVRRMFTQPEPTDATTHPYENECAALGGVLNQWGQRVTSFVPLGPSLMISTSAKWPCEWEPKYNFLADDKWKEYGMVYRLNIPGHLCAPVAWTNGPTTLRFIVSGTDMAIEQDGNTIAKTGLAGLLTDAPIVEDIDLGTGIYGPFNGVSLQRMIQTSVGTLLR